MTLRILKEEKTSKKQKKSEVKFKNTYICYINLPKDFIFSCRVKSENLCIILSICSLHIEMSCIFLQKIMCMICFSYHWLSKKKIFACDKICHVSTIYLFYICIYLYISIYSSISFKIQMFCLYILVNSSGTIQMNLISIMYFIVLYIVLLMSKVLRYCNMISKWWFYSSISCPFTDDADILKKRLPSWQQTGTDWKDYLSSSIIHKWGNFLIFPHYEFWRIKIASQ